MNKKTVITPQYKYAEETIESIINDFDDGKGEIIFKGRNEIRRYTIGENTYIVKRFKKNNIFKKISYIFTGSKAQRAFDNAIKLQILGISTPKEIAYSDVIRNGLISYSYLLNEYTDAHPIVEEISDPTNFNHELIKSLAHFFARLHEAGIIHHDLNSTNILYRKVDDIYIFELIDINRMTFYEKKDIPEAECFRNMSLFCDDGEMFSTFLKEYIRFRKYDEQKTEILFKKAKKIKQNHDKSYHRRKKILRKLGL